MQKHLIIILLCICLLFSITTISCLAAVNNTNFVDVAADAWYAGAVDYCQDNGLMGGVSDTSFAPNTTTSRAMLLTVLYRQAGSPAITESLTFTDTAPNAWYSRAIAWAVENDIASGYNDNLFGVDDALTREQIVTILWRNAGRPAPTGSYPNFANYSAISPYATVATDWALENGIIAGKPDNYFDPQGKTTRAETAVMLQRYFNRTTPTATPENPNNTIIPPVQPVSPSDTVNSQSENTLINFTITIHNHVFAGKLYHNKSVQTLIEQFPFTISMSEMNGIEKYYFMPNDLPTDITQPSQIHTGDFMLYGDNCLVLFYDTFSSSYSYTPLGYIEDITGLAEALGNGSVQVTFALEE